MKKLTLDYFRDYANSKGGKLLSKTYIDTKGRLGYQKGSREERNSQTRQ